jgi:23S rRNA pseudouridine1911/1915/1917 synthase
MKPLMTSKQRLDHYLADTYPEISRAFLQKLCNTEQVLVNGEAQKSGYKIVPTDKVEILYDMESIGKIDDIELPVLYEDKDILVIDKPAGVISHARGKYWDEPSVASFVRQRTKQIGERAGIVHRLDRVTSGVMICAKNQASFLYLQKQFAERAVSKTYIAVVRGELNPPEAVIDMPIGRNPKAPATFRAISNGKPAQTTYKQIHTDHQYSTVELKPLTGRTHQLRVHLAHIKHPIIGDALYGGEEALRLLLHAYKLKIKLPGGKSHTFTAPLPNNFKQYR